MTITAYPVLPHPVGLYRLPMNANEVNLRSLILLQTHLRPQEYIKRILGQGGRKNGPVWETSEYTVALEQWSAPDLSFGLHTCSWIYKPLFCRGHDFAELYAFKYQISYNRAVHILASHSEGNEATNIKWRSKKIQRYVQDREPLTSGIDWRIPPLLEASSSYYYNPSGIQTAAAVSFTAENGESCQLFKTLWRNKNDNYCKCLEIFPSKPYQIYNEHMIERNKSAEAVFVESESLADFAQSHHPEKAFTAVPGGLVNFPDADLKELRGRRVHVVMSREDLLRGRLIEANLLASKVGEAFFSIGIDGKRMSFVELEDVAAEHNVELPPGRPDTSIVPDMMIIQPGTAIPGSDVVRRTILDPIIREGYLVWLYAEPKIGKTWLALAITHAIAAENGVVVKWRSPERFAALYVDGEMLPDELQESIAMVMIGAGDLSGKRPFSVMCAKSLPAGVINLESEETQRVIETALMGVHFLVLDNFQGLTSNGPSALRKILPWLRRITRNGVAVLVLDHTNREGDLQGSIGKERLANLVISLRYPDDTAKAEKRFLVEFPQARRLRPDDAEPFELQQVFGENSFALEMVGVRQSVPTTAPELATRKMRRVAKAIERAQRAAKVVYARRYENLSFPQIEAKYGISRGTAHPDEKAADTLTGANKAAFDVELSRLIAERQGVQE